MKNSMKTSVCPVTGKVGPNAAKSFDGFHISYCWETRDYGSDTTALVLGDRVFFILNGNHADALISAANHEGVNGCIKYFAEHIGAANNYSEHKMATMLEDDVFNLYPTTVEIIGKGAIDIIRKAAGA